MWSGIDPPPPLKKAAATFISHSQYGSCPVTPSKLTHTYFYKASLKVYVYVCVESPTRFISGRRAKKPQRDQPQGLIGLSLGVVPSHVCVCVCTGVFVSLYVCGNEGVLGKKSVLKRKPKQICLSIVSLGGICFQLTFSSGLVYLLCPSCAVKTLHLTYFKPFIDGYVGAFWTISDAIVCRHTDQKHASRLE